jgi:hypothetical protein
MLVDVNPSHVSGYDLSDLMHNAYVRTLIISREDEREVSKVELEDTISSGEKTVDLF